MANVATTVQFSPSKQQFDVSTPKGTVWLTLQQARQFIWHDDVDIASAFGQAYSNPSQKFAVSNITHARGIRPRNYGASGVAQ